MFEKLSQPQLQSLLNAVPDPVWVLNSAGEGIAANAAGIALVGNQDTLPADHALFAAPTGENTLAYVSSNQTKFHFYVINQDVGDNLTARIFRDISEEIRLADELAAQSLKDPSTGLLNERGLLVALEPQVSRSRRYQNPLSIVKMNLDIDGQDGDLRRKISHVLKDQLRWADLIGCGSSPNDFIMILPETQQDDALRITEKLQNSLLERIADNLHTAYGVVQWQKQDNTQTLLNRADTALQQAVASNQAGTAIAS